MGLKADLTSEVATIFRSAWEQRDGEKVPEAEDLKLGNDADIPVTRFVRRPRPGAASGSMSGIEVLVMGGETNTYWLGGDFSYVTSASVDKWR